VLTTRKKGAEPMEEVLDERKKKILKAIIKTYMETGEPVGSRTISKFPDLKVSSATIRNEMSDLTDMGYIVQPHTSAGRIPSDKGYRLYVDELTKEKESEIAEIRDLMIEKTDKMEKVLKQVAKVLASNTNYATMVTVPQYSGSRLKFIQLSRVGERQLITVVVCEGNVIRNQIINIDEEIDDQTILKLNLLLNTNLNGVPIQDINLGMIARLKEQAGSHSGVVARVLDAVAATIHIDEDDMQVYTSGANNIFKYPELADKSNASNLISAFEDKQELVDFVKETMGKEENTGIQVYIGDEVPVHTMKDCSVVTATYELGEGMRGTIGIIGPKRMDYENVVDSLKELKNQLDQVIKNKT
jgi:heat-inducible transcriptional repressor